MTMLERPRFRYDSVVSSRLQKLQALTLSCLLQVSRARAGVHVNNATTLILDNRASEAEESVTRAVRENPTCRESLELLVYVLLRKRDTKKALRVLKEAQVVQ